MLGALLAIFWTELSWRAVVDFLDFIGRNGTGRPSTLQIWGICIGAALICWQHFAGRNFWDGQANDLRLVARFNLDFAHAAHFLEHLAYLDHALRITRPG